MISVAYQSGRWRVRNATFELIAAVDLHLQAARVETVSDADSVATEMRRLVEELARELATRTRPALSGLATPRPTRRPGGRLDLARTLRANLAHTRRLEDGRVRVVPERPVFSTRVSREADWRLVLVVDVSGSMEASVIWSALTAAVLAGVPTLSTHFLAFSTDVVDLTDRVEDPLSLLLVLRTPDEVVRYRRAAIPEAEFAHRGGQITKADVRALAVAALRLRPSDTLWDIGAGSGSVGIEAALGMPAGAVYAVDKSTEQIAFVRENAVRFRTPQVEPVYGEELAAEVMRLPVGAWSGPVRSVHGLHLIWIHETRERKLARLEDVRSQVVQALAEQRQEERLAQYLHRLREESSR